MTQLGCSRLQGLALFVSAGTEKLCSSVHLCCAEVATKVYPDQPEKYGAFAEFCLQQLLLSFSLKLVTKKTQQLPQFMALLSNDLAYLIAFVYERFSGMKGSLAALRSLRSLRQQILSDFVNVHRGEINEFLSTSTQDFDRATKRVILHLTRLGNVLRPVLLGADFVNILVALLQEAQHATWKLIFEFTDIGADEIKPIELFAKQMIELPSKVFIDPQMQQIVSASLPFSQKLMGLTEILPLGLVAIINAYHRDDFHGKLKDSEIAHFVAAIFADSALKSEFLYELSL